MTFGSLCGGYVRAVAAYRSISIRQGELVFHVRLLISLVIALTWAGPAWAAQASVAVPRELTIEKAEELLGNNPALRAQRQEIEVEQGDVLDAEKYLNPTLSFGSTGLVFDSDKGRFLDRMQPSITFRQEIVTGGKLLKRKNLEMMDAETASMRVHDLQRLLRFDLKQAYFQVVLAQKNLEVAQGILDQFREVVRLNQRRYDAGEISGGELRRTQAAEYPFFADVVDSQVRLETARSRLLALLGCDDLNQDFQAVDDFDSSFTPPSAEQLRETALRQRPDLALERALVRRADLSIELEKARSKPNPALFAGYERQLDSNGPLIGIDLPLSIFNRNQGPIYRANAEKRRQENQVLFSRITVLREMQTALQQLNGDRKRIEALRGDYLDKSQQARDITESSYRLGEASLIEFLDAERTYSETRLLYNQALYDFEISRAALESAVGEDL